MQPWFVAALWGGAAPAVAFTFVGFMNLDWDVATTWTASDVSTGAAGPPNR
jgi:hypothetical protein